MQVLMFQVVAGPAGIPSHVGLEANMEGNLVRSTQKMSQKRTEGLADAVVIMTQSQKQMVNFYSVSQDFHGPSVSRVSDLLNAILLPFCLFDITPNPHPSLVKM